MPYFFSYWRKLIFGSRNHEKIWVSGKLGYEGPSNFKTGVNCAEWPCLYTTYEATCTLKRVINIEREAKMANLTNFALFCANCL